MLFVLGGALRKKGAGNVYTQRQHIVHGSFAFHAKNSHNLLFIVVETKYPFRGQPPLCGLFSAHIPSITQTKWCSERSNLNLKSCATLPIYIWKSFAKNEENLFSIFFIIIFLLIRILSCKNVEKSQAKNEENLSIKFQFMQIFLAYVPWNLCDA